MQIGQSLSTAQRRLRFVQPRALRPLNTQVLMSHPLTSGLSSHDH